MNRKITFLNTDFSRRTFFARRFFRIIILLLAANTQQGNLFWFSCGSIVTVWLLFGSGRFIGSSFSFRFSLLLQCEHGGSCVKWYVPVWSCLDFVLLFVVG